MCGEKFLYPSISGASRGSPPHVRGKEGTPMENLPKDRITPACAGKRRQTWLRSSGLEDHPRMCGEKRCLFADRWFARGSPPHVRGKGILHPMHCPHGRITPACAGKSLPKPVTDIADTGSPPHVRGKDHRFFFNYSSLRITPACAGKRVAKFDDESGE